MVAFFKKRRKVETGDSEQIDAKRERIISVARHFESATGPYKTRSLSAAVLIEIDTIRTWATGKQFPETIPGEPPTVELRPLNDRQETLLLTVFACYLFWTVQLGLRQTMDSNEIGRTLTGIKRNLQRYTWFDSDVFASTWTHMGNLIEDGPGKGEFSGASYPWVDVLMAANSAGHDVNGNWASAMLMEALRPLMWLPEFAAGQE